MKSGNCINLFFFMLNLIFRSQVILTKLKKNRLICDAIVLNEIFLFLHNILQTRKNKLFTNESL